MREGGIGLMETYEHNEDEEISYCPKCGQRVYEVDEWACPDCDDDYEPECGYCHDLGGDYLCDYVTPCPYCLKR